MAEHTPDDDPEVVANARLIAAAPDLLAACQCEEAWDAYARCDEPRRHMHRILEKHGWNGTEKDADFVNRIRRDAIAKATESPVVS